MRSFFVSYCLPALQRARLAEDGRFAERVRHSIVQAANDQHRRRFGDCSSYTLGSTGTDSGFAWESSHDLRPLSFAPAFYIKYIYSVYIPSMYNLSRGHFDVKVT
jgi:hypothetical protein